MADVDKLNFAKDFEEPPVAETPQTAPEPQEFVREIDLGDGSGKQIFKAATQEELLDKLADAHVHATKKIQELSRERKRHEPEKRSSDWQEISPQQLRPEELAALQNDPRQMFRRMYQAEFGMTPEESRQRENDRRRMEAEAQAQGDFVRRHADEYAPTPQNADKIYRFLNQENLPVSRRNLDYAFEQLRQELSPRISPESARERTPEPRTQPPAPPAPQQVSSVPASLRPSLGGRAPIDDGAGFDAAEMSRIAAMPLSEMKARIEYFNRQSRTGR
jgi:hypothetical protein